MGAAKNRNYQAEISPIAARPSKKLPPPTAEEAALLRQKNSERTRNMPLEQREASSRMVEEVLKDPDAAMRKYEALKDTDGGRILNTDLARELSPDYAKSPQSRLKIADAVHEPASWLIKRMYEHRLAETPKPNQLPVVYVMAGGPGSGKSSAIEHIGPAKQGLRSAQIVLDTTLSSPDSAIKTIDKAIAAGKRVSIVYVNRDPVNSLIEGVLTRVQTEGRSVPLNKISEGHAGSAETIHIVANHYKGNPKVDVLIADNTGPLGTAKQGELSSVQRRPQAELYRDLDAALEQAYKSGAISMDIYKYTKPR